MIGLNSDERLHIITDHPDPFSFPPRDAIHKVTDMRTGEVTYHLTQVVLGWSVEELYYDDA